MKLKVSSVLDLTKYLETKTGQELKDLLEYIAQLSDEVVTALTSNLSYNDNFSAETKRSLLRNGEPTVIKPKNDKATVKEIRARRIYDDTYYLVQAFGWHYNGEGEVEVQLLVAGAPVTLEFEVDLLILYG